MTQTQAAEAEVDVGLRSYMLRVYNYMASGLALTGLVAAFVAGSPAAQAAIFGTPLMWVAILAPIGLVFFLSFRVHAMRASTAQTVFWIYAALNGVAFSTIFLVYTGTSIARVFFITAATFGAMSLYGYTTKRDLTGMGAFLFAGLIGILLAALVNLFLQSSALQFAISVIGVVVFVGLTAYDTQRIKEVYFEADGEEVAAKKSIMGALTLYLDFINIFVMLMQLFGERK
ncbi:MAG: Bax inhibitor-1/YccA family protein [Rhodospirillales bacterium]